MNLTLHQFKTDTRHFRWRLAILWTLFLAEVVLTGIHSLGGVGNGLTHFLLELTQTFYALPLIAALVLADPLVGTDAGWLTRPVRRRHLFRAKTAFIIVWLLLPWLAAQVIGWLLRGYSLHLVWAGVEETVLYGVPCVLVVAGLAALTRNHAHFYQAVGITIGGLFAASVLVEMLVRAHLLTEVHLGGWKEIGREESAQMVGWLVLAAGALLAWVLQARRGRWWPAVGCLAVGLFAFPAIQTEWSSNLLAPRLKPSAPLTVSLLETNQPGAVDPQNQLLSGEIAITGVPPGQVAVMQDVSATMLPQGTRRTIALSRTPYVDYQRRTRPAESSQQNEYLRQITGFFPADTIWFNYYSFYGGLSSAFQYQEKNFPKGLPPGKLDGTVTVDLYSVKAVAMEPLQRASFQALPGLRVTIQDVRLAGGEIEITLDERYARLMFDRNVDTAVQANNSQPLCTYFLYDPKSGEAFALGNRNAQEYFPAFLSGESDLSLKLSFPYPALRERLAGVTAADWIKGVRLCVFAPVYAGTSQLGFHRDDYHWPKNYDADVRHQKENLSDSRIIAQATLPADATAAQRETYLDEILLNIPDRADAALSKTIVKKLLALGTNGLPALLQRLPLRDNVEYGFVFPAVNLLITRDQLPDLRAALQRDDNVVTVFKEKHWEADARDVLIAKLPNHQDPLSSEALRIAAGAHDPATYADLRWHFVHLEYGSADVVPELEKCPGFDTAAAVSEAWQNVRIQGIAEPSGLAAAAARQGLPDALNLAVVHAGNERTAGNYRQQLAQLAALTGYDGPTNSMLPWLTSNLPNFRYDPAQQRYSLDAAH